ncbi:hypothetical protein NTGBS_950048 [Candidatus Nitrotoga sp. BS]|nr:hypothetical protein NTGBS_950048 [Candidatus Nitrotoga sp. BS]
MTLEQLKGEGEIDQARDIVVQMRTLLAQIHDKSSNILL